MTKSNVERPNRSRSYHLIPMFLQPTLQCAGTEAEKNRTSAIAYRGFRSKIGGLEFFSEIQAQLSQSPFI